MVVEQGILDWGSFIIGVAFASGVFVLFDLIRSKRSLKESKKEIAELKKKMIINKEKSKSRKKKE